MDKLSLKRSSSRMAAVSSAGCLLLSAGSFVVSVAAQTTEHPYVEPGAINSETCLTCHPAKKEGKFVHSAVGLGCESCHQATSGNSKTTVALLATGGELCAVCHEAKKDPVLHGPYKDGLCLVCHEPHTSNFPGQARAATETLCMSCHGVSRPDVKVSANAETVSMLGGRTLALAAYESAPKVGAGHVEKSKLRMLRPSDSRKAPLEPDAELNCISCHDPHANKVAHLQHQAVETQAAIGNPCLDRRADINSEHRPSSDAHGGGPNDGTSQYLRDHFIGGRQ